MRTLVTSLGVALAVHATAAVAVGITYDCDTAASHYSQLDLPAGGAKFTVSGIVQLNTVASSTKYGAVARVHVATAVAPGQSATELSGSR